MPVAEAVVGDVAEVLFRIVEHPGHVRVIVFAGVEQAGDGRRGDGRPAAAPLGAVLHAAVWHGALVDIGDRLVDDLARHGDARIAAAAQPLHLRDRGRPLVEVVAVLRAHIAPAPVGGLGTAGKFHRLVEHPHEFLAAAFVLFLPEHLREEEHREAVAVGVAIVPLRVADQAVGAGAADEIVDRLTDRLGILPLRGRRAFHEQRRARQRRHGRWVAALVGRPTAPTRLLVGEPVEPLGDHEVDLFLRRRRRHQRVGHDDEQRREDGSKRAERSWHGGEPWAFRLRRGAESSGPS